jgi:hypothetical protein
MDTVVFYGSSTGGRAPERNRRIEWCRWAAAAAVGGGEEGYEFKITRLVQMRRDVVVRDWDTIRSRSDHVSPLQHTRHKFIMNIEGNTCRFDVWPLATNSLVFVDRDAKDELVYHDQLKDREHWVQVDMNDIEKTRKYYMSNPHEAENITQQANELCKTMFDPSQCMRYTADALIRSSCVWSA